MSLGLALGLAVLLVGVVLLLTVAPTAGFVLTLLGVALVAIGR